MTYSIKEIFYTLQGEGAQSGRAAVFCRFSGCNLWSGREQDRLTAVCSFCDTDFVGTNGPGGGRFGTAEDLAAAVRLCWDSHAQSYTSARPFVVCTGGEPLLQLDTILIDAFHDRGLEVSVETNGTYPAPSGLDWICVSPKAGAELLLTQGNEIKVVWPQKNLDLNKLSALSFEHFFLQPVDHRNGDTTPLAECIHLCCTFPQWRLSLQTHKVIGIP